MESVTFSPGPAPVTASTDMSYTVLIDSPVKRRVVEFWSASSGLVMFLIPESLLLAKMTYSGMQKTEDRIHTNSFLQHAKYNNLFIHTVHSSHRSGCNR